jgi:hypothetical protein
VRALALVLWVVPFAACGASTEDSIARAHAGGSGGTSTGGSGATSDASAGAGAGPSGGASGSGGFAASAGAVADASLDSPSVTDAGWFDCGGCACDGTTHYCVEWVGGGAYAPPPPPPDAAVCAGDAGFPTGGCLALPANCSGPPSCDCVPTGCGVCTVVPGGLLVTCYFV